jgi:hypothetical protein
MANEDKIKEMEKSLTETERLFKKMEDKLKKQQEEMPGLFKKFQKKNFKKCGLVRGFPKLAKRGF